MSKGSKSFAAALSRPFECQSCGSDCITCDGGCVDCDRDVCTVCAESEAQTEREERAAEASKRAKQLACVFFGFCVKSDAYDAATRGEIIHYLHDHVRNPGSVDVDEVLRIVNRLLEACK